MQLYMEVDEIYAMYRDSRDKREQIKILAQLNLCREIDILNLLEENGMDVSKIWLHGTKIPGMENEICRLCKALKNDNAVARKLGVSRSSVARIRRKYGIASRDAFRKEKKEACT